MEGILMLMLKPHYLRLFSNTWVIWSSHLYLLCNYLYCDPARIVSFYDIGGSPLNSVFAVYYTSFQYMYIRRITLVAFFFSSFLFRFARSGLAFSAFLVSRIFASSAERAQLRNAWLMIRWVYFPPILLQEFGISSGIFHRRSLPHPLITQPAWFVFERCVDKVRVLAILSYPERRPTPSQWSRDYNFSISALTKNSVQRWWTK